MIVVTPHPWTPGDNATSVNLQTLSDASNNQQLRPWVSKVPNSVQSIPNNAWTGLLFQTTNEDTDTGVVSASTYKIITAGVWHFDMGVTFAATTGARYLCLGKNGVNYPGDTSQPAVTAAANCYLTLSRTVRCAANDLITVGALQTSGAALATVIGADATPFFEGYWLRA